MPDTLEVPPDLPGQLRHLARALAGLHGIAPEGLSYWKAADEIERLQRALYGLLDQIEMGNFSMHGGAMPLKKNGAFLDAIAAVPPRCAACAGIGWVSDEEAMRGLSWDQRGDLAVAGRTPGQDCPQCGGSGRAEKLASEKRTKQKAE